MVIIKDYMELKRIINEFDITGKLIEVSPINNGIINTTYLVVFDDEGKKRKFVLQKINTNVFKKPYQLMKNIENVTSYMKNLEPENDSNLSVIETKDGASLYMMMDDFSQKEYYRVYNYIDDSVTYNQSVNTGVVYSTGKAFGHFQKVLRNYPVELLSETIENFHNTKKRFQDFLRSYKENVVDRNKTAFEEIAKILSRKDDCNLIVDMLDDGTIPVRVTHNDTKVNNVLMNKETKEPMAVIDLDTVMPGSGLYDYGDGVRSACSTALEDEKDLSKVSIDMDMFKAYTDGYLSEMAPYLVPEEVDNMANAIKIITLELSMRFLGDYLDGDIYFKTNYETHNLDRARNQLKLVEDIESKLPLMESYIKESYQNALGKAKVKK